MNSVAFMGLKGGNGSTTSAHLCCLGAAWSHRPAYFLHTDMREPPQISKERPYRFIDARNIDDLTAVFNKLTESKGDHLVVLDSGGNRPKFDAWIAESCDLVVIPTDLDPESVKLAISHAETLKGKTSVKILVRCPLKPGKDDQMTLDTIPKDILLGRVDVVAPSKRLKADDGEGWVRPTTKVNNLSRAVYSLVAGHFNPPIDL